MKKLGFLPCLFFLWGLFYLGIQWAGHSQIISPCQKAFQEEQNLELFIKAEKLMEIAEHYLSNSYEEGIPINGSSAYKAGLHQNSQAQQIARISNRIGTLSASIHQKIKAWERAENGLSDAEIKDLKRDMQRLENILHSPPVSVRLEKILDSPPVSVPDKPVKIKKTPAWEDLMADPSLTQANILYQVQWPNNQQVQVIFSPDIIKAFFRAKNNSQVKGHGLQIARKVLKTIANGYTNGARTGIRIIRRTMRKNHLPQIRASYNQLFEIRTVGRGAGSIRMGGFIHNGQLYVVHYARSTDHEKVQSPFINTLLEKQAAFLHEQAQQ